MEIHIKKYIKNSYFGIIFMTTVSISIKTLNYVIEFLLYSSFIATNFVIQSNQRLRFSPLPLFNRLFQQTKNNKRWGTGIKKKKKEVVAKKEILTNLFIGRHACISIQGCMHKWFSFNTVFGKEGWWNRVQPREVRNAPSLVGSLLFRFAWFSCIAIRVMNNKQEKKVNWERCYYSGR